MRISDWSSDVCSSDLSLSLRGGVAPRGAARIGTSLRLFPWKAGVGLGEKLFAQQNTDANGSEIFNGDAEKGIPQTARADLLRAEPERFRDPLQVMRCVLKLHREMSLVTTAVCGVNGGSSRMLWRRSRHCKYRFARDSIALQTEERQVW